MWILASTLGRPGGLRLVCFVTLVLGNSQHTCSAARTSHTILHWPAQTLILTLSYLQKQVFSEFCFCDCDSQLTEILGRRCNSIVWIQASSLGDLELVYFVTFVLGHSITFWICIGIISLIPRDAVNAVYYLFSHLILTSVLNCSEYFRNLTIESSASALCYGTFEQWDLRRACIAFRTCVLSWFERYSNDRMKSFSIFSERSE
jgi:hypothetical protein